LSVIGYHHLQALSYVISRVPRNSR